MNYLSDNRTTKRRAVVSGIVILVVLALFLFTPIADLFGGLGSKIGLPVWRTKNALVATGAQARELAKSKRKLIREKQSLQNKLDQQSVELLQLRNLEQENNRLREAFDRLPSSGDFVLATIVAKPPKSLYDTLVLDIGSNDGVEAGDRVFARGEVLLGEITKVHSTSSTVELYSTGGRSITVMLGPDRMFIDAKGRGAGNFKLKVPQEIQVVEGDVLAMPSTVGHIMGVVEKIIFDQRDPFQTVLARIPVNIQDISFVYIER